MLGVATMWLLARATPPRVPQLATLGVEIVVLAVAGSLPVSFPSAAVAGAISFAAGLQIAAFDRIGSTKVTTIVMTTNSRHAVDAFLLALATRAAPDVRAALRLVAALAAFVLGVFAGALLTDAVGGRAGRAAAGLYVVAGALFLARPPARQPGRDRPVGSAGPFDG